MVDAVGLGSPVAVPAGVHEDGLARDIDGLEHGLVDGALLGTEEPNDDPLELGQGGQRQAGEVRSLGEPVEWAIEIGARIGHHRDPADLKLGPLGVQGAGSLPRKVVAELRPGEPRVGLHPRLDGMTEVHPPPRRRSGGGEWRGVTGALVRLLDECLVGDVDLVDHQEAEVGHEERSSLLVTEGGAGDVEPEALPLEPAPVQEGDVEVELDAPWLHGGTIPNPSPENQLGGEEPLLP